MAAADAPAIRAGLVDIIPWDETDDAHALVAERLARGGRLRPAHALLVSDRLWAMHVLGLQRALPGAELGLASELLRDLRMVKDPDEIALLRMAAQAADRVVAQIAAGRLVGRAEVDVSREVRERLLDEGHELAEFAIVASGPNSASPHHMASDRVIQAGEPIVLDIGGTLDGYCSDTTRTLWVTGGDPAKGPTDEFRALFDVLRDAQAEASSAVRPGVPCERIDQVARGIITAGGHGPHFIHRRRPRHRPRDARGPLSRGRQRRAPARGDGLQRRAGDLSRDRYGARIEDIVVCGPQGPDVLNESSRDLWVVPG